MYKRWTNLKKEKENVQEMDKFSSRTGFDGWGKHFLVAKLSESLPGAHQFFYTLEKVIYEKSTKIHKNPKNHHINI